MLLSSQDEIRLSGRRGRIGCPFLCTPYHDIEETEYAWRNERMIYIEEPVTNQGRASKPASWPSKLGRVHKKGLCGKHQQGWSGLPVLP